MIITRILDCKLSIALEIDWSWNMITSSILWLDAHQAGQWPQKCEQETVSRQWSSQWSQGDCDLKPRSWDFEGCLLKYRDIYLYLTYIFWDFHSETANISLGDRKYCWGISLLSGLTQRSLHQWSNSTCKLIYIYQHIHHPSLILIHQNQDRAVYLLIQTQWRRIEGAPASRMCIVIVLLRTRMWIITRFKKDGCWNSCRVRYTKYGHCYLSYCFYEYHARRINPLI